MCHLSDINCVHFLGENECHLSDINCVHLLGENECHLSDINRVHLLGENDGVVLYYIYSCVPFSVYTHETKNSTEI